ncbi:MAG: formylglycine-generating enzyme family protein [Moorea sp. SIO4A3]|nr:formylglycine-generating enzyme family protein [Moorena sp. SIO4A3]
MQQAYIACCPDGKDEIPGSFDDILKNLDDINQPTDEEKLIVKFVDSLLVNGNIPKSEAEQLKQWLERNANNVSDLESHKQNLNPQPDSAQSSKSSTSIPEPNKEGLNKFLGANLLKGWLTKIPIAFLVYYLTNKQKVNSPAEPKYLKQFSFEVVTVNRRGAIIKRESKQACYLTEDLGNGVDLKMVYIPAGTFLMGSPETEKESDDSERPQHRVSIQPFFLGKYSVTQAQWRAVANLPKVKRDLDPDPSEFKGENRPVERVDWFDAVEFCDRLCEYTGTEYRLPSEAEWEYACRARTTTPFHYGETISSKLANYSASYIYAEEAKGEFREETTPVGHFRYPNGFGLYDMHGNVCELCGDPYHDNYKEAPTDGSIWTINNNQDYYPVLRGGSWLDDPGDCRSAFRDSYLSHLYVDEDVGFRVARGVGSVG